MLQLETVISIILTFLFFFATPSFAHPTACDSTVLVPGPAKVLTDGKTMWQHVQFNQTPSGCEVVGSTRGQLYLSRTNDGLCELKSIFHLPAVQSTRVWVAVNGAEFFLPMQFGNYGYGMEHQVDFSCPAHETIEVRFAFDLGHGDWDNNGNKDYRVVLPFFK